MPLKGFGGIVGRREVWFPAPGGREATLGWWGRMSQVGEGGLRFRNSRRRAAPRAVRLQGCPMQQEAKLRKVARSAVQRASGAHLVGAESRDGGAAFLLLLHPSTPRASSVP